MYLAAKSVAEKLLVKAGIARLALGASRRRTLVLAYHNVVPAGEHPCGDLSLHMPQTAFAAQLDSLWSTHDVIPLVAIDAEARGRRPRVVITFDDAYRGAVTCGIAEVVKRGLPATIFAAPGLFGATTWWDRLAEPATGAVPPAARETALAAHEGRSDRVIEAFGPREMALPPWAGIATEEELCAAATQPGITLGAHSWSHANLTALGPEDLAIELLRPLSWLRTVSPRGIPWLAYTYGLTSPTVAQATQAAGYSGAFRIDGGWMPRRAVSLAMRYELPRLNVPSGLSLAGFRLRTAGVLVR